MHIGFVALDYPSHLSGGGVGNQVRTLAQALVRAGHRVTVVALAEPQLPAYDDDGGIIIYRVARGNLHWYASKLPGLGAWLTLALRELESSWTAYRQIAALHRETPFDLIEGTETGAFCLALCLRDVPLVIRLHGEMYTFHKYTPDLSLTLGLRLSRVLQRVALRRARLLISPSRAHAREIAAELGSGHPPTEVIPNTLALPLQGDSQAATDTTAAIPCGPFILYVGRLERLKGIPMLIEAAHQVIQAMPDVRFVLAGGYHPTLPRVELERLVRRFGLDECVHVLGHVPREQLANWYRRAAICVLPSYYETFGLAALEPMAFGVPVVTTSAGGLPEVVEEGVTGILVPPGDAPALAGALIRLLGDPDLRSRIGSAGRARVEQRFDVAQHLDTTLRVFQRSMTNRNDVVSSSDGEHVFFSPHFDDVVLSCGGLIASLLQQGRSVRVITVFAGNDDHPSYSAYARHLHAKWETGHQAHAQRLREDLAALRDLGVQQIEQWDFPEAPYRLDAAGLPLYASYDELRAGPAADDWHTAASLSDRVAHWLGSGAADKRLYFPLSLGQHVDHQLLFRIGIRLRATGCRVRFYEEWPYVESYTRYRDAAGWSSHTLDILLAPKIRAAVQYASQLQGLGGSAEALAKRLAQFAYQIDGRGPKERYWEVSQQRAIRMLELVGDELPFSRHARQPSLGDFGAFLDSLRWHDVDEVLPIGEGDCLDLGCGSGRQRSIIQQRGYRWIGMDRAPATTAEPVLQADGQRLPFRANRAAAVVAWQVLEYVEQPERMFAEVARVLEPGGVFCGSVSFLEPVHGRTLYGTSPFLIEYLLGKYGFTDIQIRPGLSGFALMLWTWLRRWGGPAFERLALPLAATWLVPTAALRFLTSWLWWRLGRGSGHGMRWIAERAPLEFAGHVMFTARKAGRSSRCISDS